MADFYNAYKRTIKNEGSYSDVKGDRGGETYKGISRKFHFNFKGWETIDYMKGLPNFPKNLINDKELENDVFDFYKKNYWDRLKCSSIKNDYQDVAEKIFDIAVNQGVKTASKYFQESLNLLNNNEEYYKNLKVDGKIGNKTMLSFSAFCGTSYMNSRNVKKNAETFLTCLYGFQLNRYIDIVKRDESQEKFFYGWLNRI